MTQTKDRRLQYSTVLQSVG